MKTNHIFAVMDCLCSSLFLPFIFHFKEGKYVSKSH